MDLRWVCPTGCGWFGSGFCVLVCGSWVWLVMVV